jgi:Tol biopolymer transport system component
LIQLSFGPLQQMDNLVGYVGDVSWMPDGRHVVLETGPPDGAHLWMADTQSRDAAPLTAGSGSEHQPSVRPDGSGIAFHDTYADLTPIIVSLEEGTIRDAPGQTPFDWAATWSMHSNVLAWNTMRNGVAAVWVRDANGSERVVTSDALFGNGRDSFLFLPAPSPDGSRVAFSRMAAEGPFANRVRRPGHIRL